MSQRSFRILVIAYGAFALAFLLLQPLMDDTLPEDARAFLGIGRSVLDAEHEPFIRTDAQSLVYYAQNLASTVGAIGLLLWKNWARTLFLVCVVASIVLTPLSDLYVDSGWVTLFGYICTLLEGALLALIYFSPLEERFTSPATNTV